jgi:citrate lyase subunit beta/citryl-CoA lyase
MRPIRSFLFVPGHRESWIDRVAGYGADAVILDLEDSVPADHKAAARALVANKISGLAAAGQRIYVRVNRSPAMYDFEDVLAVTREGLEGLVLSKPGGPEDGLELGRIALIPTLETARSMQTAYEIAQNPRVSAICGASAKNGDSARALGISWSPEGTETLYMWQRTVMAARAAGKMPLGGLWQDVHDLEGLDLYARRNRAHGFVGEMILHPSNVEVVNRAYTPSAEEIRYFKGMIEAYEASAAKGVGAVIYDGDHIDLAHVQTARAVVALAKGAGETD